MTTAGKPNKIEIATRIEWTRGSIEDYVIELYRLIDATPDNEAVDPLLASAYQSLHKASDQLNEARRVMAVYATKRAERAEIERAAVYVEALGITDQPNGTDVG